MRRLSYVFVLLLGGLLWAGTAAAIPVVHTLNTSAPGATDLSGDVSGAFSFTINTNLGGFNGTGMAMGSLVSTPNGSVSVDWGDPSWSGSLDIAAGGLTVNAPTPGAATGDAVVDLSVTDITFDLVVNVDNITIGLASPYNQPTSPAPNAFPYFGTDTVDLALSAQVDIAASGPLGINIGANNVGVGPSVVPGVMIGGTFSQLTSPDGTRLAVPIPGIDISLGAQPASTIPVNQSFAGVISIDSVTITLTDLTFSDVTGVLVFDQTTTAVPEPALALVLGLAMGGLALGVFRR